MHINCLIEYPCVTKTLVTSYEFTEAPAAAPAPTEGGYK